MFASYSAANTHIPRVPPAVPPVVQLPQHREHPRDARRLPEARQGAQQPEGDRLRRLLRAGGGHQPPQARATRAASVPRDGHHHRPTQGALDWGGWGVFCLVACTCASGNFNERRCLVKSLPQIALCDTVSMHGNSSQLAVAAVRLLLIGSCHARSLLRYSSHCFVLL